MVQTILMVDGSLIGSVFSFLNQMVGLITWTLVGRLSPLIVMVVFGSGKMDADGIGLKKVYGPLCGPTIQLIGCIW